VHNRRYLLEFLDRELARSQRHGRPLALALLDLDHFKAVNDKHGHLAGDMVLRQLATLIRTAVRKDELLARYGGEEFALVLPEADPMQAIRACERVRQVIETHAFVHDGQRIPVTVSVGLATTGGDVASVEDLFAIADRKLYEAKIGGRNRVAH
jgi:diguanylate cyclase (GGDEF)-like protein